MRPRKLAGLPLLIFLFGAADVVQQEGPAVARVRAAVEDGRVILPLADNLPVTLSVEGPSTIEVAPVTSPTLSKDWELERTSGPERVPLPDGRVRWQLTLYLAPLKTGAVPLPLAPLRFRRSRASRWEQADWKPIPVRVTTEIGQADLSELRDVTSPEDLPAPPSWAPTLRGLGTVLALAALLAAGWTIVRLRQGRGTVVAPDEWALQELERLVAQQPSSEAEVGRFHTELSDIVRHYLELRFRLPAQEQTTDEFLESMRRSPELTAEQQSLLRDFMERCDLVKFARANPALGECRATAAMARAFVASSTQQAKGYGHAENQA